MTYAAVVSLAQVLEQILHHDRFFYIHSSDEERKLESLQEKVSFLQGFLDNYPHKAGETIQSLVAQIGDTAYQVQDIIEYHISDRFHSGLIKRFFRQLVSTIQKVVRQTKYEEDLQKALEQIDSVVKEATNTQMNCTAEEIQIIHTPTLPSSSLASNGRNQMVGLDEAVVEIKERLCGESSKLKIIPIVGMGGIGKTTLARNIFDDSLIVYHFHTRVWVTISQEHHLRELLIALLKSLVVTTEDSSRSTNEELMEYVYKSLKGRTYLIILDDMWSRDAWDDLRRIFPNDNNGSRIVITTRLADVAEYASCSPIHQMHFLNEDQSWNLLQEKLVYEEQSCPPELEEIGRIVAKNCGGLPLAIAVVAGILTKVDRTQYHWKNIAENISLAIATTGEHFSKILALSYDHLPHHLKACFLYMGVFPEDCEIYVSELIMLWVAEGFLKPIGSKSLEEVAEECLEDLIRRNVVLIIKKSSNGKFRSCGMHDLLRDFCIQKAVEENFLDVIDRNGYTSGRDIENQRRLTIRSSFYAKFVIRDACASPIRSVFHHGIEQNLYSFVLCLRLLRVLDIPRTMLDCFRVEITELFHLRYLAFAYDIFTGKPLMLPASIYKLHNLQTLIIDSPFISSHLALEIWRIPQLRHLILRGKSTLNIPLGSSVHVLENLQTLSGVMNFEFTSKAVCMILNIKKLKVLYTDLTEVKWSKLCLNNLVHLHKLETLNLDFTDEFFHSLGWLTGQHFYPVIPTLPPNLKKLTLKGWRPPLENMSIIGLLPNLQVLKLTFFDFWEGCWESNEGRFPRLNFLLIDQSNLIRWRAESNNFPCLHHLIIRNCRSLEEIPCAIGDITALELIEVGSCSKSSADSAVLILEEQRSLGNHILQVRLH